MVVRTNWAAAGAVVVALVAMGQGAATPAKPLSRVETLVRDLGSSVYATREQAQKDLMTLPITELDDLRKAAAGDNDPETTLRLREVLHSLESIEATTTPSISIDVKDATYSELGAALAKATGTIIAGDNLASRNAFTLSAKDRPFWDIIDQLCQQHPVSLAEREGLTLKPRKDTAPRYRQYVRGVLFSVGQPQVEGQVMMRIGRNVPARPTTRMIFSVGVAVDPRISVYQNRAPIFLGGTDDLGNEITAQENEEEIGKANIDLPSRLWDRTIDLLGPEKPGTKVTLRGKVSFAVVMGAKSMEATIGDKQLNEAVDVGNLSVTLRQIAMSKEKAEGATGMRGVGVKLEIVPKDRGGRPPEVGAMTEEEGYVHAPTFASRGGFPLKGQSEGRVSMNNNDAVLLDGLYRFDAQVMAAGMPTFPLEVVLLDGEGHEIMSRRLTMHSASTVMLGTRTISGVPAKIVLRSGHVRDVTVPFEFKDLPLKK